MSRDTGDHTMVSSLSRTWRTIWNPHVCGALPGRAGYRRLLNGIAISAVNPSATGWPPDSKRASHDRSPRGTPPRPPPLNPPPRPPETMESPCTP